MSAFSSKASLPTLLLRLNHQTLPVLLFGLCSILLATSAIAQNTRLTDKQIRQQIITESLQAYSGSCPCPYSTMRNGSLCGQRSAWSRSGGSKPICYENEVTAEMIAHWRRTRNR